MREWIARHYVGLLALFVALGGTAYASTAAKDSVTSRSIRTGAVKSSDVKDNGIKGVDVDEATLDFSGLPQLVGPPGPVGPTFATVLANPQDPVPPATPDVAVLNAQYSHTFVTPVSGRLLVFASLKVLTIGCSVGFGNAFLYLDGVGVPGSGQRQPDSLATPATYTPIALSGVVPAGQHTLSISLDCPTGNHTADGSSGDGDLGALLVGS